MNIIDAIFLAALVHIGPVAESAVPKPTRVSAGEAERLERAFNGASADKSTVWKLVRDQSFRVPLNDHELRGAVFAAFVSDEANSVRFALLDVANGARLAELPQPEGNLAVASIFAFRKIDGVSFQDVNADGTLDALVVATYFDSRPAQGEGVGGGVAKVGFAFVSDRGRFVMRTDCDEAAGGLSRLARCLRAKFRK